MSAPNNLLDTLSQLKAISEWLTLFARADIPPAVSQELHNAYASIAVAASALERMRKRAEEGEVRP